MARKAKLPPKPREQSPLELEFAHYLRCAGVIGMVTELPFAPPRRWRFDFAWPDLMLAVELEGGTFGGGRHTRGKGFEDDCVKYNAATIMGWHLLRFTSQQVTSGYAINTTIQAIQKFSEVKQ